MVTARRFPVSHKSTEPRDRPPRCLPWLLTVGPGKLLWWSLKIVGAIPLLILRAIWEPLRRYIGWERFWIWCANSPYTDLAVGAGTVGGSAFISVSGGKAELWWLMVLGSLLIIAGLTPSFIKTKAAVDEDERDALLDARASVADEFVRTALDGTSEVISLPRADRVARVSEAVRAVVEDIWTNFYSKSEDVRVVFYRISDDGTRLEPELTVGRKGDARVFDAIADERGKHGLEHLDIETSFEYFGAVDELPPEWDAQDRGYVSFVSVPVRDLSNGYGLISVDSSDPDVLDQRDGDSLAVYASALAFYFAAAERGRHRTKDKGDRSATDRD